MDKQLQVLEELISVTEEADIPIWIYGGYGLEALVKSPLRPHKDIDIFIHKRDKAGLTDVLTSVGFDVFGSGLHYVVFTKNEQHVECTTFEELDDGTLVTDTGDTGVFPWPANSFPKEPNADILKKQVRVISYEA